jgi:hypothetical protein
VFFLQIISSDIVLNPIVLSSPRCLSSSLVVCLRFFLESHICTPSPEISCHAPPSCFHHRLPVQPSQAVVASLFPDRRVACKRKVPISTPEGHASFLKPGLWWLVVVRGSRVLLGSQDLVRVLIVPTQETASFFPARAVVGFSVWFCIFLSLCRVSLQWTDIAWAF